MISLPEWTCIRAKSFKPIPKLSYTFYSITAHLWSWKKGFHRNFRWTKFVKMNDRNSFIFDQNFREFRCILTIFSTPFSRKFRSFLRFFFQISVYKNCNFSIWVSQTTWLEWQFYLNLITHLSSIDMPKYCLPTWSGLCVSLSIFNHLNVISHHMRLN